MKTLTKMLGVPLVVLGVLALAGVACLPVNEASASTAETLQPASVITYNDELVVNNTARFDSVYIGKQDEGGVTFFNGTIINNTTTSDAAGSADVENPVTFGDDVRIDGKIWRTEEGGDNPLKIADTIMPAVNNTYDLGTSAAQFKNGYFAGTLSVGTLSAGNVYTKTEVDAMVATGGHDHIGETWTGSVQGGSFPAILTLANTGNGYGLIVATSSNYTAIAGATSGTSAAVSGTNTGSGSGVSGIGANGYGVYAKSTSGDSLYVDGKVGMETGSNKAVGTGTIPALGANTTITNSLVTTDSLIFVQMTGNTQYNNSEGLRVDSITNGSFDVYINDNGASADVNIPFAYLIIN